MKKLLDEQGRIAEPSSRRYGELPLDTKQREKILLKRRWFWLLIPIVGTILYIIDCEELTDEYGYSPWWL